MLEQIKLSKDAIRADVELMIEAQGWRDFPNAFEDIEDLMEATIKAIAVKKFVGLKDGGGGKSVNQLIE